MNYKWIGNTLRLSENSLNFLTNILQVSIILFKVQRTKALKKRSTHSFILTERASGKTAADVRVPMAEKRLRTEMRKVALEPDD